MEFHPKAPESDQHRDHSLGRIPVLEDGDVMIYESGAIAEYIVARHSDGALKPTLMPKTIRPSPAVVPLLL